MTDSPTPFDLFIEHSLEPSERAVVGGQSAVVCDAGPGNLVVFVSSAFEAHTGYRQDEAVGRNLSFLQRPDTEPEAVELFRYLIRNGTAGTVRITNYRKDKTRFLHECELRPVRDAAGGITHFIAIQRPI